MSNNIPWSLLSRNFHHQADTGDKEKLEQWLKEDAANPAIFDEIKVLFNLSSSFPGEIIPDLDEAWRRINPRLQESPKPAAKIIRIFKYSAAAVGLLLLGMALHWMVGEVTVNRELAETYTEIVAPAGQKAHATLPDGTQVWLNAGSALKYNTLFNRSLREVTMSGEVFFDVKKDHKKQFRIKTGELRVDVYGTSFNIKNHSDDLFQEITVAGGTVGLHYGNREIRHMGAGQQAIMDKKSGIVTYKTGQPELVAAWKENELIFDDTPIEEAVKYLERWYGVNITIDDAMRQNHRYTFKVKTETFREMMELMKRITPLTYEVDGKNVRIRYANKK